MLLIIGLFDHALYLGPNSNSIEKRLQMAEPIGYQAMNWEVIQEPMQHCTHGKKNNKNT